jgi:hypothetical protein
VYVREFEVEVLQRDSYAGAANRRGSAAHGRFSYLFSEMKMTLNIFVISFLIDSLLSNVSYMHALQRVTE